MLDLQVSNQATYSPWMHAWLLKKFVARFYPTQSANKIPVSLDQRIKKLLLDSSCLEACHLQIYIVKCESTHPLEEMTSHKEHEKIIKPLKQAHAVIDVRSNETYGSSCQSNSWEKVATNFIRNQRIIKGKTFDLISEDKLNKAQDSDY